MRWPTVFSAEAVNNVETSSTVTAAIVFDHSGTFHFNFFLSQGIFAFHRGNVFSLTTPGSASAGDGSAEE